jgi:hypothetical protein
MLFQVQNNLRRAILLFLAPAVLIVVFGGLLACSGRSTSDDQALLDRAVRRSQNLIILPFEQLPKTRVNVREAEEYREPYDADSIELFSYRGGEYYHPTNLCHRCQVFIATYYNTKNKIYLDRAEKYAAKIMSECLIIDGVPYATFRFRYAVHSDSANTLPAPWFSGMSQGELLLVMVRLYEFTGDRKYLEFADRLFKAFLRFRSNHKEWIVRLDSDGYYWIEEYPHDKNPGRTLNGFIASLFGIYDYYRLTGNPDARTVWDLSLTTIKNYLPQYRRKNKTSLYCLEHAHPASEGYHNFHIQLMGILHRLTGDPFFEIMADVFIMDKASG